MSLGIRVAEPRDWAAIWPIFRAIAAAGETYAYDPQIAETDAREMWMAPAPHRAVVAVEGDRVLGTARMGPNRDGPGAHVATASFMVDPAQGGRGIGRALGEHVLDWTRDAGYRSIQFNAVVETNERALALWRSLGFSLIGTVPEAFRLPDGRLVGLCVMWRRL